ncbi:MAG: GNAT family N-acetyltransferase [Actinomycetota bacterium]
MREEDLSFVVGEHLQHFPRGFFARLGPRFLHEYYRAFLTGDSGVAVVAEEAGRPVGYLVGVTDPAAHREHVVRRHGRGLALRGAALLAVRPRLLATFVRTRAARYLEKLLVRRAARSGRTVDVTSPAVLTHVAVTAHAQGKGIGTRLVEWFEQALEGCGCDRVVLVTAAGREGAGEFYERRGWTRTGEHATADGHLLSNYEYRFDDEHRVVQA